MPQGPQEGLRERGQQVPKEVPGHVLISSQDAQIKTKEITEKIDMDSAAGEDKERLRGLADALVL